MTAALLIVLLVLFVGAGGVMLVSLVSKDRGINFYDLDNEDTATPGKWDVLRKPAVFYTATAVLLGSAGAYLWWRGATG
nr:hypothetical protein HUO10_000446 [Paraburkholderia busanensis]